MFTAVLSVLLAVTSAVSGLTIHDANDLVHLTKRGVSERFVINSIASPGLCLDDKGTVSPAAKTPVWLQYCNIKNRNQWFVYDYASNQLQNPAKKLCLEFAIDRTKVYLNNCSNAANQKWWYSKDIKNGVKESKFKAYGAWDPCLDKNVGGLASNFRMTGCYGTSPDQFRRFELIRAEDGYGPKFLIANNVTYICVTANGLGKELYVTTCNNRFEQQFVWHAGTYMLKSVHFNLCVQRDAASSLRLQNCNSTNLNQKFFAADFRIKMSHVGNWGLCVGSVKNNISDNLVKALDCWKTPDDRIKYIMYSLDSGILAQGVKNGKELLQSLEPKSTFW